MLNKIGLWSTNPDLMKTGINVVDLYLKIAEVKRKKSLIGGFYMKICKTCGKQKSFVEFYKCKTTKDGYLSDCKECHNNRCLENYEKNKSNRPGVTKKKSKKFKLKEFQLFALSEFGNTIVSIQHKEQDIIDACKDAGFDVTLRKFNYNVFVRESNTHYVVEVRK